MVKVNGPGISDHAPLGENYPFFGAKLAGFWFYWMSLKIPGWGLDQASETVLQTAVNEVRVVVVIAAEGIIHVVIEAVPQIQSDFGAEPSG